MAKRNISATINIGAKVSASVNAALSGVKGKLDALGESAAKIKQTSKELEGLAKATAKLDASRKKVQTLNKAGEFAKADKAKAALEKQAAAVEKLRARLRAAGVDTRNLSGENERLGRSLASVQTRMEGLARTSTRIENLRNRFSSLKEKISGIGGALSGLKSNILGLAGLGGLGLTGAGYLFKTQFIDTAAAFERYRIQLAAFGDDSEKALGWSEEFALKTNLNLDETVQAYLKLRQQGLDPTDGTLQALVDSISKVGGKFYDLEEVISQLGQAWRKEKLTAEDVKPLLNRGIPVYEMLAKAMKKTTKEIVEMQSKGKLGKQAISAMLFELGKWSKGTSEALAGSWEGIIGRFGDYWIRFKKLVMESGPFMELKKQAEELLNKIEEWSNNGQLKAWAEQTGAALVNFIKEARTTAQEVWSNIVAVKEFVGGWKNLAIAIGALALAPTIASLVTLGVTIGTLLGPWGLLAAGVVAVVAALYTYREEITAFFAQNEALKAVFVQMTGGLAGLYLHWDKIVSIVKSATAAVSGFIGKMKEVYKEKVGALSDWATGGKGVDDSILPKSYSPEKDLMPAESMPAPSARVGSGVRMGGTANNTFNVNISAPGADGKKLGDEFTSRLKSTPLFDETGTLTPQ